MWRFKIQQEKKKRREEKPGATGPVCVSLRLVDPFCAALSGPFFLLGHFFSFLLLSLCFFLFLLLSFLLPLFLLLSLLLFKYRHRGLIDSRLFRLTVDSVDASSDRLTREGTSLLLLIELGKRNASPIARARGSSSGGIVMSSSLSRHHPVIIPVAVYSSACHRQRR